MGGPPPGLISPGLYFSRSQKSPGSYFEKCIIHKIQLKRIAISGMKLGAKKKLLGGRGVATFQPGCTLYFLVFCILVPINFTGFRINLIKMLVCCSYSLGVTVNKRVSAAPPPPPTATVAQPLCVTRHTTCDRLLPSACRRPYVRPAIDSAPRKCAELPLDQ